LITIVLVLICLLVPKETLFFSVNTIYNGFFDIFFYAVTELGNTLTYIAVLVVSLFLPRRFTFALVLGLLISSSLSLILKHLIFTDSPRPLLYFKDPTLVHHLSISKELKHHSFPSGHTISAFTLASVLVGFLRKRKFDVILLLIAYLVGYSRVYLGQHFVADAVFGSIVGVFSGTLAVVVFRDTSKLAKPIVNWWGSKPGD
jgi:membrane-associated phospholipid phosphatase